MANFYKTRNPGMLVEHIKIGKKGRTYNTKKSSVSGKVLVYFETGENKYDTKAVLCDINNIKVIGFID